MVTVPGVFRSRQGVLFWPNSLLRLQDLDFYLPVSLTLRGRKRVVITEVPGLNHAVKEVFPGLDLYITATGLLRSHEASPGARLLRLHGEQSLYDYLERSFRLLKADVPIPIHDVNPQFLEASLLETLVDALTVGNQPEGILSRLGIRQVLLLEWSLETEPDGRVRMSLRMVSEEDETSYLGNPARVNLFLEET